MRRKRIKVRPDISTILECPKCGSSEGYYFKMVVRYAQCMNFSGEPTGATEMMPLKEGDVAYCAACHRAIANVGVSLS